jgi:hypothetical protein
LIEVEGLRGPGSVDDGHAIAEALAEAQAGEHYAAIAFARKERAHDARPLRHLAAARGVHDLVAERPVELTGGERVLPRSPGLGELNVTILERDAGSGDVRLQDEARGGRGLVGELHARAAHRKLIEVARRGGAGQLVARAFIVDILRLQISRHPEAIERFDDVPRFGECLAEAFHLARDFFLRVVLRVVRNQRRTCHQCNEEQQ